MSKCQIIQPEVIHTRVYRTGHELTVPGISWKGYSLSGTGPKTLELVDYV